MASVRARRQQAICDLVRAKTLTTQAELVKALAAEGFKVTQTTVSRDIAELGLVKAGSGAYVLPQEHRLKTVMSDAVIETRRAGNQVLVFTQPGSASSVAAALDAARPAGMLGCIAGDDTILVICPDDASGEALEREVNERTRP